MRIKIPSIHHSGNKNFVCLVSVTKIHLPTKINLIRC